jgi:hypothetical protein
LKGNHGMTAFALPLYTQTHIFFIMKNNIRKIVGMIKKKQGDFQI